MFHFYTPDVLRGYRSGTLVENELSQLTCPFRYKEDIASEQKEALLELCKKHTHRKVREVNVYHFLGLFIYSFCSR